MDSPCPFFGSFGLGSDIGAAYSNVAGHSMVTGRVGQRMLQMSSGTYLKVLGNDRNTKKD